MFAASILATLLTSLPSLALPPPVSRDQGCSAYTLINARGTYEPQAESAGFLLMNQQILSQLPNGNVYNVVFPATAIPDDNILPAGQDILREIECTLEQDPGHCFILQGYSLGATATISTLPNITGAAYDAVKGLFVIGDPVRRPGLACNFDNAQGTSTRNTTGFLAGTYPGIPEDWVSKSLDICIPGDGACDERYIPTYCNGTQSYDIPYPHLMYPSDNGTISAGVDFILQQLGSTE